MIHKIERTQHLSISLAEAWSFFSSPLNLPDITPPWLAFSLTSGGSETMYPGMIITYCLKPLMGVPVCWVSEITHVAEPHFFVDEQRIGPYRFWHHQHFFREGSDGVDMTDIVHYALGWSPLGELAHRFVVRRKLESIFDYRRLRLAEIFPSFPTPPFSP
jgi:ligand-binding SRPBCC domain-containing protein